MTGNDLKALRLSLGLTQTQMAKRLGYATYLTVLHYEKYGEKELNQTTTRRINATIKTEEKP